jgi:hypothetical protein
MPLALAMCVTSEQSCNRFRIIVNATEVMSPLASSTYLRSGGWKKGQTPESKETDTRRTATDSDCDTRVVGRGVENFVQVFTGKRWGAAWGVYR